MQTSESIAAISAALAKAQAEIEITPEMVEAGLDVYAEMNPEVERASEIVSRIYCAMRHAKLETISPTD